MMNPIEANDDDQRQFLEAADRYIQRNGANAQGTGFSPQRWTQFAEMGWLGLGLPETLGGFLTLHEAMLLMEKLGAAGLREPLMDNLILCGHLLATQGSPAQRAICADMVQGNTRLALAVAETGSRHDWAQAQTSLDSATLQLTGQKCLVSCAEFSQFLVVLARETDGTGLTALLLPTDRAGVSFRHGQTYDGHACSDVSFDRVQVFANDVVGDRSAARLPMEQTMQRAYVALACEAAGAMRSAYTLTLDYARTRKQFGRALTANQAYQHALVDMYVAVEEGQGLAHHASRLRNGSGTTAARWASAAKAFACADGRWLGEQAVQLHGAIGMTEDYALGRHYKRLAAIANQYGDADWHLLRIRELDAQENHGT